ncbi:DUF1849 family protein [Roseomonas sp. E05]|uniref:EipB family protein n=1 Tax=Roseomonas sp. E05 TaxID=3046310 RepID=UPI0024B8D377|nr:DUF1849 family protein [Roseomonas sp. E05]MDJ0388627.1 DUF1849 family protein [Roseomonas sp. E05]
MRLRDTLAGSTLLPAAALMLGLAQPVDAAPAPAQGSAPAATAQAAPIAMAAHRAAYRLELDRLRQGGDVIQADGAMLFEVLDACDGWTTRQRLKLNVVDRSGSVVETSSDYSTWESKDGKRLRFTLTQMAQGAVTQRIAGEAELEGAKGGVVRYESPAAQEVKLPPGTLLPMAHTIRTLELARAGQRMLLVPLFDGTSEEGAQDTTTILSSWQAPRQDARFPLLKGQGSARMRIAFFSEEASAGANLPEYEVGLRYYANGVADDMNMDFGDFAMNAVMQKLEALPSGC